MDHYEIERKWLLDRDNIPYDLSSAEKEEIEQAYISFSPTIRIRKINNEVCILTVKSKKLGKTLARREYEMKIDPAEYEELMKKHEGIVIEKTRYKIPIDGSLTAEIDLFSGEYEGLAYMEIEFPDEASAEAFPTPSFARKDVSSDKNYTNASLAKHGKK